MYWGQLNFAMFFATSAFGISWHYLNHQNMLLSRLYWFYVYFPVRTKKVFLPNKDGFNKVKNYYIERVYYSICDECGFNTGKIRMSDDWSYTLLYAVFSVGTKGTKKVSTRKHYTMNNYKKKNQSFTRKVIHVECLFSFFFSVSSKVEHSRYFSAWSGCSSSI